MGAQLSLIADVESAIASGSSARRIESLRRVTDLFMVAADAYNDSQISLFDDVIGRLADQIEVRARAELSNRLAPVANAPLNVMRALARDDSIDVAGPVLSQSPRLSDADLLACAREDRQDHLLAIAKRSSISETVTDMLVMRGNRDVVRNVARNGGARFSQAGFGKLVERGLQDEELAVSVGLRRDIPKDQLHALLAKASETVKRRLADSNAASNADIQSVLSGIAGPAAKAKPTHDYGPAQEMFELIQQAGKPLDPFLHEFAKSGKFEETVVALASMCQLPLTVVENTMSDKRLDDDLLIILAKSARLTWPTTRQLLQFRANVCGRPLSNTDTARMHYDRLQASTAQRVVRFYQVRNTPGAA